MTHNGLSTVGYGRRSTFSEEMGGTWSRCFFSIKVAVVFHFWLVHWQVNYSPEIFRWIYQKWPNLKFGVTFFFKKAHHFGALHSLVFGGVAVICAGTPAGPGPTHYVLRTPMTGHQTILSAEKTSKKRGNLKSKFELHRKGTVNCIPYG